MEDNVRAVEYICGHFPMLANKTVEELNGNQKTLKEIIKFYKSVPIEKASSKQIEELNKHFLALSNEELKIAIKASLIYEGEMNYPTDIKNHSIIDGHKDEYQLDKN